VRNFSWSEFTTKKLSGASLNAALPTFSAEAIVRDRIGLLETSTSFIAALAQIPQSRLSLAFSGTRPLSRQDGVTLKALTARLLELRDAFGVVPLAFDNADRIRRLLACLDKQNITAEVVRQRISDLFQQ
jgi:hypothetical protein